MTEEPSSWVERGMSMAGDLSPRRAEMRRLADAGRLVRTAAAFNAAKKQAKGGKR